MIDPTEAPILDDCILVSKDRYDELKSLAADGELLRAAADAWSADGRNLRADLRRVVASYQSAQKSVLGS